ncbi:3-oxoacyl-[acyl-carrier-protein] synthase III C-terminal domain-containing protein [Lyngbya sp. CCAP 1446/10]|uniref:3-oxoacyl-[acyl-carrier-protein] synthase III C-terminal domain-containing protein n=1 Tax=Lyngbya sp. CCAP 1446/10 TaxID=439293 RepID=UPI002237365C|nr:3-oxoacyl-[acyl-carrier-protein] synthase III C-terminal domain-containing protein [Lyngbya sp. CCAP 1446/10]
MMNCSVGIRSLSLCFPSQIRTNDYWLEKFPHLFAVTPPRRTRLSQSVESTSDEDGFAIWSQEVAPYLSDPFRGNVERRVLGAGESSLMLECRAAREALDAAKLSSDEVELAIVASIFPEQLVPGNASYLARELQLQCPAWNLESTCSSALIALQNARALVQTGEYRNVLVVVSHIESNSVDEEDTLSWSMGDAAGAFVVDSLKPDRGVLGSKIINTAATCDAYLHELIADAQGKPRMRTRTGENASSFAETSVEFVRTCCEGAVAAAGVTLEEIDFFAFNTPTAWYARLCARALGIDPKRAIDLYPWYANIGSVFAIANLYHAALAGKIRENDLVLVYTNGAAATAAATVMRWGDVALGTAPAPPINLNREEDRSAVNLFRAKKAFLSKEKLFAAAPTEQQQILETYLIEWLTNSLQLPVDSLSPQHSLALLLDSLMAFELRSRIETDLQVRVPIERFFGDNNITQLAELVLNQLALANLTASESVFLTEFKAEEEREILSI